SGWQPRAGRTPGCRAASSRTAALLAWSLPTAITRVTPARRARSRTRSVAWKTGSARWQWVSVRPALLAGNRHARDRQRGRGGLVAEGEVAPDHLDVAVHLAQVAGDRDLLDRVGQLPPLDPVADRAAGVVARHEVDPEADQLGHVQPAVHRPEDRVRVVG